MSTQGYVDTNISTAPAGTGVICTNGSNLAAPDDDRGKGSCGMTNGILDMSSELVRMGTRNSASISAEANAYKSKWSSCISRHSTAAGICLENLSTKIQTGTAAVGIALGAGNVITSANGSCGTVAKVMDIGNKVLTAYNVACTAAKTICTTTCSGAIASLKKMDSLLGSDSCMPGNTACVEATRTQINVHFKSMIAKETTSGAVSTITVSGKKELCSNKYTLLLVSSATGIASMLATMNKANDCKENTAGTTSSSSSTAIGTTSTAVTTTGTGVAVGGATSSTPAPVVVGQVVTAATAKAAAADRDAQSVKGNSGAGSGVGSANGSSLSLQDASAKQADPRAVGSGGGSSESSGAGGSSSGGEGSGSGSRMTASEIAGSKYGSYLPGGKQDPGVSGDSIRKEITGEGGRSNWQKVHQHYGDIRSSLIGD